MLSGRESESQSQSDGKNLAARGASPCHCRAGARHGVARVPSVGRAADRDAAMDDLNDTHAQAFAPLSKPATLGLTRGRSAAPNTLPDPAESGLYDDGSGT